MKNNIKILIPNATSPVNIGDQATLEVLLKLIGRTCKNAQVKIHSTDPQLYKKNANYEVKHTLYSWAVFSSKSKPVILYRLIQIAIYYILKKYRINIGSYFYNRNELSDFVEDFEWADLIVFAPGGYLRSKRGVRQALNLIMQLVSFEFAKLFNAKTIVCPISFGPFAYSWQRKMTAVALKYLDLVAAREKFSYESLKECMINNVILSSDYALLIKKKARKRNRTKNMILGFTIRKWLNKKKQEDFEESFVEAISKFSKTTNVSIQPIVQVNAPKYGEDDSLVTKKVFAKMKSKKTNVLKIKTVHNVQEALDAYSSIDLLLGMRMHSNILAAVEGTPFVAISYEHKSEGITRQLIKKKYCIKSEIVDKDNLYRLLVDAYKNKRDLRKKLNFSIKKIQDKEIKRWNDFLS